MCKETNKNTIVSYDFSTLYTTSPQTFVSENPPISLKGLSNGNNRFILLVTKDKLSLLFTDRKRNNFDHVKSL